MTRRHFGIKVRPYRSVGSAQPHHKLGKQRLLTGVLRVELEALTPIHVGSGAYRPGESSPLVKEQIRSGGRPIIPGTSVKGVCRFYHEALTGSPAAFDQDNVRIGKETSPSAAIFGGFGYQGRISFDDAVWAGGSASEEESIVEHEIARPYPPPNPEKLPAAERRFYGRGRLDQTDARLAVETLADGSRWATSLRFRNVFDRELGGVLLALGVGHFTPKLGGGKYDGLGQVRFEVKEVTLRPADRWRSWNEREESRGEQEKEPAHFAEEKIEAFKGESGWNREVLKEICEHLGDPAGGPR